MNAYVLSARAEQDLAGIWEFLAADNLDAADRVVEALHDGIQTLAKNPGLGHERPDLTDHAVKFFKVSAYLVVFEPRSEPLAIVRILHGRRDVSNLI